MTPPDPHVLARRLGARLDAAARRWAALRGAPVGITAATLQTTVGYRLPVWVHQVAGAGPRPGLVLCPPHGAGAAAFAGPDSLLDADALARAGFAVLRFDPPGRGAATGEDDLGGPEHQDAVRVAVAHLRAQPGVDGGRVGLLSVFSGLSMAAGAAAAARVAFVLDVEGPADRESLAGELPSTAAPDALWWSEREPVGLLRGFSGAYVRLQGAVDLARPGEIRHALRMVRAAVDAGVPFVQLNDHAPGEIPVRPRWIGNRPWEVRGAAVRKAQALAGASPA
jgi:hypothetical protein